VPSESEVELRKPWGKVKGTFIGVGKGALEALNNTLEVIGGSTGDAWVDLFVFTVVYTIAGPVYMVKGGVSGARQGLHRDEIEGPAAAIGMALQRTDIQTRLRDEVSAQLAASVTSLRASSMDEVPKEGYTALRAEGFDTVLELSVLEMGLRGGDSADPPLQYFMEARARLIRTKDSTVLFEKVFYYSAGSMTFGQWGEENAREFVKEISNSIVTITGQILQEVFDVRKSASSTTVSATKALAGL
jgi:hypothetical protein